ncbi:hypothetical protein H4R18_004313 [Coemansia javaensis]|uniref:Uncharacterized protein n=1 Tax=Coemansia javaensis TaxID=2761396 RepID=A0A9W8H827_9FUNG|nr:hypothetical protein H4R18_004313 [Coemansia javaensis]
MSFSLTQAERDRVAAAAALGIHLDPIGRKDLALVVVISAVYGVDLVAVGFLLWHRNWPPLKSKSPLLMAAGYVACVCWFVGDLQINGHVHLRGTALEACKGIGVWVRVLLGVCAVSALIAMRSYGLFRVFCLGQPYRGRAVLVPAAVYCACALVCGIVAQALSPAVTVEYIPALDTCYCPKPFRAALYGCIWATWATILGINWRIRHIKTTFNEWREMAFSCLVVFAILTFSTVLQFARPDYPFSQTLRLLTTYMDHLGTNLVWWAIMGAPLFHCLVDRAAYLEEWTARLRRDGLQNEYQIPVTVTFCSEDVFFDHPPVPPEAACSPQTTAISTRRSSRSYDPKDPFDIPPAHPLPPRPPSTYQNDPFQRP